MNTTVERVDDTTVKLSITVEAERVAAAVHEAARHVAREVRIPGFRPGKAPRRVLESHVGSEVILDHAVRDAVPVFFREAVEAEGIVALGQPEFDVETFEEGADAVFTATVEVRPDIEVPNYEGLQVPHPEWEVTDEEVAEQLEELRERFAELITVDRPAQAGDHVVLSMSVEQDGTALADLARDDALHTVTDPGEEGSEAGELDRQLIGAEAGQILAFSDELGEHAGEHAGKHVDVRVIVKEVKALDLPELDDEFAITASEYDTFAELEASLRTELARARRGEARAALRGRVVEAVLEPLDVPLPDTLVNQELEFRLQQIAGQAERYNMNFEQFLAVMQTEPEELVEQLRGQARDTVKAQLVLDAIGEAAGLQITQDDLEAEVHRQAGRLGRDAEEIAELMGEQERFPLLLADTFRRKTIDHLLDAVQVISSPPEDDDDLDDAGVQAEATDAEE